MHERKRQAELKAIAEQAAAAKSKKRASKNQLTPNENMAKKSTATQQKSDEQSTRQVKITYGKDYLVDPDETTVTLMVKERESNYKAVNEAKLKHAPPPKTGNDTLMWMACSGTKKERAACFLVIMPPLFEENDNLSKLLHDKNDTVVIDKIEFKRKGPKLLAPKVDFHIRNDHTHSETHYQCKFTSDDVEIRPNPAKDTVATKTHDPKETKK